MHRLKDYWELYYKLVKDVLERAERYGIQGLSEDRLSEWKNALQEYLKEIDKLSDSLPLRSDLKKPRLYFWDKDFNIETPEGVGPKRDTVKINSVSDVLKEYKLANASNHVGKIKDNLNKGYERFLKELDALEPTLVTQEFQAEGKDTETPAPQLGEEVTLPWKKKVERFAKEYKWLIELIASVIARVWKTP